jgi:hypothetical protein
VGGRVEVYSQAGQGTRVVATVPTTPETAGRPVGIAVDSEPRGEK